MDIASRIVGTHVKIFESGATVLAGGTASATNKPVITDPGWTDLGIINNLDINPTQEEKKVFAPNPGHLELAQIVVTKLEMTIKFDVMQLNNKVYQLVNRSTTLAISSPGSDITYNPDSLAQLLAWIHVQQYDQYDFVINAVDLWGYLKSGNVKFDENIAFAPFEFMKLSAAGNTGTLYKPGTTG